MISYEGKSGNIFLQILREEKEAGISGGLYHELQVRMTYHSNHIEGSKLTAEFEYIHPFQDENDRVGRLIVLKECLRHNIIPFIIEYRKKQFYYRGLSEWRNEKEWLTDTCLDGQDTFIRLLDALGISHHLIRKCLKRNCAISEGYFSPHSKKYLAQTVKVIYV